MRQQAEVVFSSTDATPHLVERRSRYHPFWSTITVVLLIAGVVGAVFAASAVARTDADDSRKSFASASANIASTLQLALQHEEDLVVSAGGYVLRERGTSQAAFLKWNQDVRMLERYPEVIGLAWIGVVPAAGLPAYQAQASAMSDPDGMFGPKVKFALVPPGVRPYYCFISGSVTRVPPNRTAVGLDLCSGPEATGLLTSRDSGQGAYKPITITGSALLAVYTPLYSSAQVPGTLAARRGSLIGWVSTLVTPDVLLERARQEYPEISVSMRYSSSQNEVEFKSSGGTSGRHSVSTDVGNGWTVQTTGRVAEVSIAANYQTLGVLILGVLLSGLLAALVFVLGTGRERARRLVDQRTGQLRHQALHDALTGLPNRVLAMDRIEQLLARDRRRQTSGAVMFVDVDDFKNVNDTLGHAAGDKLLIAIARRFSGSLREVDTIARMGGDEFVVVVDGDSTDSAPALVAQRLVDVMRQPFQLDEASDPLEVSISVGVVVGDRADAGEMLKDADVALYEAKRAGKDGFAIFHAEMHSEHGQRDDLEIDLRSAQANGQLRLVYQPIFDLGDLTVIGVEALLRWDHPTKGLIAPGDFIPLLEASGQIREVGQWVLREACVQAATWHARGDTLDVSVNISGRQLDLDGLVDDIHDALQVSGLEAGSLIIEVAETALMHNAEQTARRLQRIRELGVQIAVDDFGTAYSSLAYLRQFPVDILKIDRMFTSAISTSPESRALVRTLVQLGRDLGLRTLAEGVETTEEIDVLRSAHVDHAQGFLMGRPIDPDTLEEYLLAPMRPVDPAIIQPSTNPKSS